MQDADPTSQLAITRQLIALRRAGAQAIHCAFNLGSAPLAHAAPAGLPLLALNGATQAALPAYAARFTLLA